MKAVVFRGECRLEIRDFPDQVPGPDEVVIRMKASGMCGSIMWVDCSGYIDPLVGFSRTKMSGYGYKGTTSHMDNYLFTKSVYIQL